MNTVNVRAHCMRPILAAGFALAMALTFSCTDGGGDEDNNGGNSSSSGSDNSGGGGGKGNDIANYKTVQIGDQWWMAENLDYDVEGSKCYNDSIANCNKYGRLYDWETANRVCPSGWHLPSGADWDALMSFIHEDNGLASFTSGTSSYAGRYLKATSGWHSNDNGTDKYGFAALPGGGGYSDGRFYFTGDIGYWWSASEGNAYYAYYRYMHYNNGEYAYWDDDYKIRHACSVFVA